jgi:hypothetical protein
MAGSAVFHVLTTPSTWLETRMPIPRMAAANATIDWGSISAGSSKDDWRQQVLFLLLIIENILGPQLPETQTLERWREFGKYAL